MAVSKNTTLPKAVAGASRQQHCFSREVGFSAALWPGANARRKRCSCTNGNLTQDDLHKFKYDAEHRLVEIRNLSNLLISSYAFDGHSLRVIKVVGADRTWYIYAGTQLVSEFEDAASANYSAGTQPGGAGSDSTATMLYQHGDHLTTRLTTDNAAQLSNQQAHYPYGEQWYATGTADPSVERKFTTYLRDDEVATGRLNYAVFREHSARVARFLTPDPRRNNSPQGLNRYAYVMGDPIMRGDSKGLAPEVVGWPGWGEDELNQCLDPMSPLCGNAAFWGSITPLLDGPGSGAWQQSSFERYVGLVNAVTAFAGGFLPDWFPAWQTASDCSISLVNDPSLTVDCSSGQGRGTAKLTLGGFPFTSGNITEITVEALLRVNSRGMSVGTPRRQFARDDKFWNVDFDLDKAVGTGFIRWRVCYRCSGRTERVCASTEVESDTKVQCR